MTRKENKDGSVDIKIDFGTLNPKQQKFIESETTFTGFGGARGGGKTHVLRIKAFAGCLYYPGLKVLIVRRTYPELNANHIEPMKKMIPKEIARYNEAKKAFYFENGSIIRFGYWSSDSEGELLYQGQEYDWVFIDEATQLTERAFQYLQSICRGTGSIPKRMYLTANPGGVGHRWFKRLFIDKKYKRNDDPVLDENPKDYTFIFASVFDNQILLDSSPNYVKMLNNLPEDIRAAHLYGDWNMLSGNYFKSFDPKLNVCKPFRVPDNWRRYISFDYGLDMFAVGYWAVDTDGRQWLLKNYCKDQLVAGQAAKELIKNAPLGFMDKLECVFAPPDMWNKHKDTGRSTADIMAENNVPLVKASNERVKGHLAVAEDLLPVYVKDEYVREQFGGIRTLPKLMFFDSTDEVYNNLADIQHDELDPNDCAKEPHELTHTTDMVRYFVIMRHLNADEAKVEETEEEDDWPDVEEKVDYETYMTGGEIDDRYIRWFGG